MLDLNRLGNTNFAPGSNEDDNACILEESQNVFQSAKLGEALRVVCDDGSTWPVRGNEQKSEGQRYARLCKLHAGSTDEQIKHLRSRASLQSRDGMNRM